MLRSRLFPLQRARTQGAQAPAINKFGPGDITVHYHGEIPEQREVPTPAGKPVILPYPSLGSLFKGRDDVLGRLRASLLRGGGGSATIAVQAVHGMGGIGKTRTAVEYAWTYRDQYTALLFVHAYDAAALHRQLAALTGVLRLPEREAADDDIRVDAVLAWLGAHPGWLLIFDNVDTNVALGAVRQMLGRLHDGHVILTSRLSSGFGREIQTESLDLLPADDAVAFLLDATETTRAIAPDDAARANSLAEELGRLALALGLAAATIDYRRCSLAEYRRLWLKARELIKGWNTPEITDYQHAVAETWAVSVAQLSNGARELLERLAFLAPDPTPGFLLDVPVPDAAAADAREALLELAAYSLVMREVDIDQFTVHRLIQDTTRRSLDATISRQRLTETLGWINAALVGDPQDVLSWPVLAPLAPHAETLAWAADEVGISEPTGRIMSMLGELMRAKAQFSDAERLARRTLEITERCRGPTDPDVAACLNNLALLLKETNQLAEAEPLFRRALAIDKAHFGVDHPHVAIDLGNLAQLLQEFSLWQEAESLFRRALAIDHAHFGAGHPRVAIRLHDLAELFMGTSPPEAETMLRHALAIEEKSLGPDHPTVAVTLEAIGKLLLDTNRLTEAEPLFRRALAINEAQLGAIHPAVAGVLNNLSALLYKIGNLTEAELLMRRALNIAEASLGANHPQVALYLANLAMLLMRTKRLMSRKRLMEAEPLMRQAVIILIRYQCDTGYVHHYAEGTLRNYVSLLSALGHNKSAIHTAIETARREAGLHAVG
jgi:tetratricopeptide (TPR) repeat protein